MRNYVKTQLPNLLRFLDAEAGPDSFHIVDDDYRVKYMDKFGIDIEILSLAYRPIWGSVSENETEKMARLANDSLTELVSKHPSRMVGICTLPTLEGSMLDELDRSIKDLGMKGVTIASNIKGKPLDSPEFMAFYEKMAHYDLPILIHPTNWKYYDWINEYQLNMILGWPFDTSLSVARIVFGGVLDRFPSLKIIAHHSGSMIPFFGERIRGFYEFALDEKAPATSKSLVNAAKMKKHPIDYFKAIYGDTMVNGSVSALMCAYDFFGPDHLVFATDYPHGPSKGDQWTDSVLKSVRAMDIGNEEKEKIFEKNSRSIFKLST